MTVTFWPADVVIVKPDVDTLLTVPDDPPAAGPDRALDPPPPGLLLAPAELLAAGEALANAAKHARASAVHVELDTPGATLRLAIRDDGIGGADPAQGSGLTGLRDRIEAVGGTLGVTSPTGGGTTLLIKIPV